MITTQLAGDHHQSQEQGEGQVFSPEIQPGKGISRQGADHYHNGCGSQRKDQGVQQIAHKRHGCKGVSVVLKGRGQGEKGRHMFRVVRAVAFHRGQDHPVKRKQNDQSPYGQKEISKPLQQSAAPEGLFLFFLKI